MAKMLNSDVMSVYCESVALMLAAGIQNDEAVYLLSDNLSDGPLKRACDGVYRGLIAGKTMAQSMEEQHCFPAYAVGIVRAGEQAGRLENVMRSLAVYYGEEDRLYAKMRSAVAYPAGLLVVMAVILAFTSALILPAFVNVYEGLAGSLGSGAFSYVNVAVIIGWVAFAIMAILAIAALACVAMANGSGRNRLTGVFSVLPFTKEAMFRMALCRFTSALQTFIAAGNNDLDALKQALAMVDHAGLRQKVQAAVDDMSSQTAPKELTRALGDNDLFDPASARMLMVGARSGNLEEVLQRLSDSLFQDAVIRLDSAIDSVEPALAALLTISVGATLIAVMIPLIGIMGSIG